MAFASVTARNNSATTTAGTSHTVSLPAGIASGKRVVINFSYAITANTVTFPDGWNPITNGAAEQTGGSSAGIATAYRDCDGSEGATIAVTTSVASRSSHESLLIEGFNPAIAPEAANTTGTNGPADPPNLAPTGGAKDYLWIACGSNSHETVYSAAPTNYGNLQTRASAGTGAANTIVGTAERQLNAASENPGAFSGADVASEWAAVTIAIHPAEAAGANANLLHGKLEMKLAGKL